MTGSFPGYLGLAFKSELPGGGIFKYFYAKIYILSTRFIGFYSDN